MRGVHIQWTEIWRQLLARGIWLPVLFYLLLYFASYQALSDGPWDTDQDGHGPFIVGIAIVLTLVKLSGLRLENIRPEYGLGGAALAVGLMIFIVGRSQDILIFDVGSQIPVLIGMILIIGGQALLKQLWFPVAFMLFAIPIPGWLMDGLTQPMKVILSTQVTDWLYGLGLPVANNGVVIYIAQYQLLVRDACVGLNSLFSLAAVGILYIYLSKPTNWLHLGTLIACILPIAIAANAIRVISLVLITYYLGDEAGRGFLHDFAGLVMFVSSLLLFFLIDSVFFGTLRWVKARSA